MLAPVRTVAPAVMPVSLAEAKAHLHMESTDTDDDIVISALIAAATDHLDGWTGILGRALVTQTWRQDFAWFGGGLRLALGPVASITSIAYFDSLGAQITLDEAVYQFLTDARGPYVALMPGRSWPATYSRPDAVSITYVAGTDVDKVPPAIKTAIVLLAAHWNENREAVNVGNIVNEMPFGVHALLAPYRRVGI